MNKSAIIALVSVLALIIIIAAYYQFTKTKNEISMEQPLQPVVGIQEQVAPPQAAPEQVAPVQPAPQTSDAEQQTQLKSEPVYDATKTYSVQLKTDKGDIVIALSKGATPNTVKNFVTLAQKGFYNGTVFHRAIKGFMIQGGDPKGDGTGGPGYRFDDEPFQGEYTRGVVAMANAGPNTNGSQFFIMHQDYPLPKNYVIFGRVASGLDVVDAIATAPVEMSSSGEQSKPVTPVKILSVVVTP